MTVLRRRSETIVPRRDVFRAIYQSARWHRFSKNYLKQNRLCKLCLEKGKTEIALQTDHIVPAKIWVIQRGNNFYDLTNLQPLCKRCHSLKTREENKHGIIMKP